MEYLYQHLQTGDRVTKQGKGGGYVDQKLSGTYTNLDK